MEDDSFHSSPKSVVKFPHHIRSELCTSRPPYRQGRKLTAVKVYTVNEESQHLLIRGVPVLDLRKELKHLCMRYGEIKFINLVRNYSNDEESFTEVYHVSFARIQAARFAKHMIDDRSFYGGVLHVCYAPELESITETRLKLQQRRYDVLKRTKNAGKMNRMFSTKASHTDSDPLANDSFSSNVPSTSQSITHRSGLPKQLFIPRKRRQFAVPPKLSVPIHDETKRKQYFPVTNQNNISSFSSNPQVVTEKNVPSSITRLPDKFIPSPLKRIKFNKIAK